MITGCQEKKPRKSENKDCCTYLEEKAGVRPSAALSQTHSPNPVRYLQGIGALGLDFAKAQGELGGEFEGKRGVVVPGSLLKRISLRISRNK
jgi:hypothetical protein